jgi:phosphoribosylglycinamide formyltransferase-1
MSKRVVVLASGGGTNLQALMDAQEKGYISKGRIALVVADRKSAGGIQRAEKAGIPVEIVPRKKQEELSNALTEHAIDFLVLSGYLSILPETVIIKYRNRIINIHPALTPSFSGMGFYGNKVHEAVLAAGVKVTGVTVHFADEGVDTGMVIAQQSVPVIYGDTVEILRCRVLETEHKLLVEVVKAWTEGRIKIENSNAWII